MMNKKSPDVRKAAERSARVHVLAGLAVIVLVLGGTAVWAARTEISGAVVSSGLVVVESKVKKVQHPTGGVVSEITVKNGSRVKAGDLLVRLDETVSRANLQVITKQLDELVMREARLEAERDGSSTITLPDSYQGRESEPDIAKRIAGETFFFKSRRESLEGQKEQLGERVLQMKEEITGLGRQIKSKNSEIEIVQRELKGVAELEKLKLVTTMRVNQLRRDATRLEGELGQLESAAAQAKGRIAEIGVEMIRIDQEFRTSIIQELRDNTAQQAELVERRIAAEDQLKRIDIRAPQSGVVHQLEVNTVGGVINQAETLMLIVPEGEELTIEARIATHDIDQVLNGDKTAFVRFSAFDTHKTPELNGNIVSVSADLTVDQMTGVPYYLARISIPRAELAKLNQKRLVPGMPAEIYVRTQNRTVLSYLFKPIEDQMERAFRER
jgi:HlyD family secretion protein